MVYAVNRSIQRHEVFRCTKSLLLHTIVPNNADTSDGKHLTARIFGVCM